MSNMILYHGSENIIEKPLFGFGKAYNDYGLGFYCTDSIEMAKEWGAGLNKNGFANKYEIDTSNLRTLHLNDKKYSILNWLSILLQNRTFEIAGGLAFEAREYLIRYFNVDIKKYDIICGYRADDSYFSFAQDFINGAISYRQLNNAMHLGKLGIQYVLKSKKAFSQIQFIDYEIAESSEWYTKRMNRDKAARREYFDIEKNRRQKGDIFITQILDEEIKPNDTRLR